MSPPWLLITATWDFQKHGSLVSTLQRLVSVIWGWGQRWPLSPLPLGDSAAAGVESDGPRDSELRLLVLAHLIAVSIQSLNAEPLSLPSLRGHEDEAQTLGWAEKALCQHGPVMADRERLAPLPLWSHLGKPQAWS